MINEILAITGMISSGLLTVKAVQEANEKIKNIWLKRKYGFSPSPDLCKKLNEIDRRASFESLKECVGCHWSLDLIRLGIHISELNETGSKELVDNIRNDISKKYQEPGMKLLNLGSTRAINPIIRFLLDLKNRTNYDVFEMGRQLNKIIDEWEEHTVFVKKIDSENAVIEKINKYMEQQLQYFFVFAMGQTAGILACNTIAKLNSDKIFHEKGYLFFNYNNLEAIIEQYLWSIEKVRINYQN